METKEKCCGKHSCRCNVWRCIGFGILGVLGFAALVILGGLVVMWLWNWLMPTIFHLTVITYWQAVGLALLFRLLFGGCGHGGRWHGKHKHGRWFHGKGSCGCGSGSCNCGDEGCNCKSDMSGNHCHCDSKSDKWKHYDDFWKEEGEKSFDEYVKRKSDV